MFCKLRLAIGSLLFIFRQLDAEIHGLHLVGSLVNPSLDGSAIGTYGFEKEGECNSLCWYRKLCTSYSYNVDWAPNSNNCVLYTGFTHATLPAGWKMMNVNSSGITNGCAPRPCGETDICFSQESSDVFACLHHPSECPIITPPPHSTLDYTTRNQNDKARVTCDQNYVITPLGTSREIQCKVTSQWEEFKGTCAKAVFLAPIPKKMAIPLQLRTGWKGCVSGVFSGNLHGGFNFLVDNTTNTILLHIALRSKDYWLPKNVITNAFFPGGWGHEQKHGNMPLTDGDDYKLSFELQHDRLILDLKSKQKMSHDTYNISLSAYKLTSARVFKIDPEEFRGRVEYVNLVSGCE